MKKLKYLLASAVVTAFAFLPAAAEAARYWGDN